MCDDTIRGTLRPQIDDYGNVFKPSFQVFSGAAGSFQAVVNMGPVQPHQRNVRVSQHSRDKLDELQQTFNDLERKGVLVKPEDIGVTVEYLNASFLVKKSAGGFRLVTAFADVGRYRKPQLSPS